MEVAMKFGHLLGVQKTASQTPNANWISELRTQRPSIWSDVKKWILVSFWTSHSNYYPAHIHRQTSIILGTIQVLHNHTIHYLKHPKLRVGPACSSGMPASAGSSCYAKRERRGGVVGRQCWLMRLDKCNAWSSSLQRHGKHRSSQIKMIGEQFPGRNIEYKSYNYILSKISSLAILDDHQHYLLAKILTTQKPMPSSHQVPRQNTLLLGSPPQAHVIR